MFVFFSDVFLEFGVWSFTYIHKARGKDLGQGYMRIVCEREMFVQQIYDDDGLVDLAATAAIANRLALEKFLRDAERGHRSRERCMPGDDDAEVSVHVKPATNMWVRETDSFTREYEAVAANWQSLDIEKRLSLFRCGWNRCLEMSAEELTRCDNIGACMTLLKMITMVAKVEMIAKVSGEMDVNLKKMSAWFEDPANTCACALRFAADRASSSAQPADVPILHTKMGVFKNAFTISLKYPFSTKTAYHNLSKKRKLSRSAVKELYSHELADLECSARLNDKSVHVFPNGKLHIVGCVTVEECKWITDRILETINDCTGVEYSIADFDIININSGFSTGFPIDPDRIIPLLLEQQLIVKYRPDKYAGVQIKLPTSLANIASISIFTSGCVLVSGYRTGVDGRDAFAFLAKFFDTHKDKIRLVDA